MGWATGFSGARAECEPSVNPGSFDQSAMLTQSPKAGHSARCYNRVTASLKRFQVYPNERSRMISKTPSPGSRPARRRWWQFSIRGLLLLTGVIAAGLGWYMWRVDTQRDAMEKLQALGVELVLGDSNVFPEEIDSGAVVWLRERLGPHYFSSPNSVSISNYDSNKDKFSQIVDQLVRLPSVKSLNFWADQMDVATFRQIARLRQVETIYIHTYDSVTGQQVEPLTTMTNLRSLEFQESFLDHSAFEMITKIASLKKLYVPGVGVELEAWLAKQRPDLSAHPTGNYAP